MSQRTRVGICAWADPALIESGTFYPRKSMIELAFLHGRDKLKEQTLYSLIVYE